MSMAHFLLTPSILHALLQAQLVGAPDADCDGWQQRILKLCLPPYSH